MGEAYEGPAGGAEERIRAEQVQVLFEQAPPALAVSVLVGGLVCFMLWDVTAHGLLIGWWAVVLALATLRLALAVRFRRRPPDDDVASWERRFVVTLALVAFAWGLGAWLAMPRESLAHQAVLYFFLMGMVGGAVASYSAHAPSVFITILAIMLPSTLWLAAQGTVLQRLMAVGGAIYILAAYRATRTLSFFLRRSFLLSHEVQRANEELRRRQEAIEAQAAQLERQNELLREHVQLQGEVERMSRHDLKTPLASILAIPKLLLRSPGLTPHQIELLRLVERAGYRVLDLVNLSLDLFRMEKGTYRFQPKAVDLVRIVERVALDLEGHAASKRVAFRRRFADGSTDGPFLAFAEELLSYSMLANLMKNALEASPDGAPVTVTFERERGEALLRIHNQGAVPEAVRSRFFEKYATSGKHGGMGLGSYSARLIAETQSGRIAMTSSEDDGTEVTVALTAVPPGVPATADATESLAEAPAAAPAAEATGFPPLKVLVVDDDPFSLTVLKSCLPAPLAVETAVNGRAALERFESFRPDLVFMDMEMPLMGGLEATARIRTHESGAGGRPAVIVGLSAHGDAETRRQLLAAGCDRYLSKPAGSEDVWRVVRDVAATVIDLPGFDVPGALRRLLGNDRLFLQLVAEFRRTFEDTPAELRAALAAGREEDARRITHTLKGAAANLSATRVADAAARLELTLRSGGGTEDELAALEEALAEAGRGTLPGTGPEPQAPKPTDAEVRAALADLARHLATSSLGARAAWERVAPGLEGRGVDDDARLLARRIEELDYAAAAENLRRIRSRLGE